MLQKSHLFPVPGSREKKGIIKFIDWDYLSVGIYIVALNLNLACFFHAKQQISIAIIEIHKENKIA